MKRTLPLTVGLLFTIFASRALLHADDPSTDNLRAILRESNDNIKLMQAVEIARRTGNDVVLLAAMDSPSDAARLKAISAMTELPPEKAKTTLLTVLSNDHLWSNHYKTGSEIIVVQMFFANSVQAAIFKIFRLDASSYNLYDEVQRAKLISNIKTR